ncbi:hypothetical protein [Candidatus Thiosymbion oneisti]|uniref:hypothetical protein n=2 Tax=Candidatus Thiosymbion oneisti TaxID=589554 RepID=UPI001061A61A|nr:hypothetical protein [Candidatus Thiosymbion oneisti]
MSERTGNENHRSPSIVTMDCRFRFHSTPEKPTWCRQPYRKNRTIVLDQARRIPLNESERSSIDHKAIHFRV